MTDFSELSDALDMEYWLESEGVTFKTTQGSSGEQFNVKECPYCADRRWRVYINAENGLGNCFVCGKTFNKLGFIHAYLGQTWQETARHVKRALKDQGWRPRRTIATAVDETAVRLPVSEPITAAGNHAYLASRGISGEIAEYFRLRFCSTGFWFYKDDQSEIRHQRFDNRIIVPVYDVCGRLVTFQGRDVTGLADRKYLFPARLPGTGRFLYNGNNVVRTRRCVIGEGVFDVIALKMALDEDPQLRDVVPIGTFGKQLAHGHVDGDDQIGKLRRLKDRGLEQVTFMWDGEKDAFKAALTAAKLVRRIGLGVRIATLPKGKDPNEADPQSVRDAYYQALKYDAVTHAKLLMRNPYA